MKRIVKISTIILIVISFLLVNKYFTSVDISNDNQLINYIKDKNRVAQVNILNQKKEGKFYVIYYTDLISENIIIFEKDNIFSNKYKYFGSSGSTNHTLSNPYGINKDIYNETNLTLIIIYGNNTNLKASSYKFNFSNQLYINNSLENYVLDIYINEDTSNVYSEGLLYDEKGNVITGF